jgi:hypothetical protein
MFGKIPRFLPDSTSALSKKWQVEIFQSLLAVP